MFSPTSMPKTGSNGAHDRLTPAPLLPAPLTREPSAEPGLTLRPRRLRRTAGLRELAAETTLLASQLMQPLFIVDGGGDPQPLEALAGQARWPVSHAESVAESIAASGVRSVILFGLPATKDAAGTSASDPHGPVPRAIRAMRRAMPDLVIAADVCLCEYTDHGHCGIVVDNAVANDATLHRLASAAVAYADAGADVVAPSAMMDGQVAA